MTCSARSTAASTLRGRHALEAIGEEGSLFLADPWHGAHAGDRAARASDGAERIEVARRQSVPLELEDFARADPRRRASRCWARDDALAQARVIEALYASAATSTTKGLT